MSPAITLKRTATSCILTVVSLFLASACWAEQGAFLITPSEPLFLTTINAEFPGLSTTEYFAQLSPYLVLLRNDGASPLKAYMVDWSATTKAGGTRLFTQHFVDRFFTDPDYHRLIQPTSIRLLSPLFNLSPREYKDLVGSKLFEAMYPVRTLPSSETLASLSVAIDGVVWMDGVFRGPNTHRSFEEYRCIRNADHDEALTVSLVAKDETSRGHIERS